MTVKTARVAIAGCPNGGKTTLFNRLTGSRQTVGNWPGQTVERHAGSFTVGERGFEAIDLPGMYGLVAVSAEEAIASRYLTDERPEVVVTVVDSTNLGTGLHLVTQLAEAGLRQVVALNMWDVALRREIDIDVAALSSILGIRVVPTVARRGDGIDELERAVAEAAVETRPPPPLLLDYGPELEQHLDLLTESVRGLDTEHLGPERWVALQLLAGDEYMTRAIAGVEGGAGLADTARQTADAVTTGTGFGPELVLAERRFESVNAVADRVTRHPGDRATWSDRIDKVLLNRWLGLPVFLVVMWIVLRFTADVTAPYLDWVDATISGPVAAWAVAMLAALSLDGGWVESLVVDGVLAGVGGVLVFVPVLFGLYLMLAILEDTGYMARAAAVMDRAMRAVGIPGKAFLPMMVGFGCTVPAIYATRSLESSRDRLLTGLLTPFMSCGARLPVYVLLTGVFFAGSTGSVVFGLYLLGIAVAVLLGLILSRTVLRESEPSAFVMVMPEFRLPNLRTVWALMSQRTWAFIKGAGTVILLASMAVWLLLSVPVTGGGSFADTEPEDSVFGAVSQGMAPIYEPAGFGEWEQSGALITGFVAKEVVVSTMAQLYSVEQAEEAEEPGTVLEDLAGIGTGFLEATRDTFLAIPGVIGLDFFDLEDESTTDLQEAIRTSFEESSDGHGSAAALAFMVFVLLYTPCMAAVAAFRQEFGTTWMWVSVIGQFAIAWIGALVAFQASRMIGL